jgi:hypothetical protein
MHEQLSAYRNELSEARSRGLEIVHVYQEQASAAKHRPEYEQIRPLGFSRSNFYGSPCSLTPPG